VSLRMKSHKVRQVQMLPLPHLAHLALSLNLKVKFRVFILYFIKLSICFYLLLENVLELLIMFMFHVYQLQKEIVVNSILFFFLLMEMLLCTWQECCPSISIQSGQLLGFTYTRALSTQLHLVSKRIRS
jgi:hypothetical protein